MNQSKVYRIDSDIYGETCITVNGEPLLWIAYHQPYGTCDEDLALTILADYFEERLTKDILDRGEAKCWRFHKDFAHEFVCRGSLIWSQDIKLWIELKSAKENNGLDLIKTFGAIPTLGPFLGDKERKVYHFERDIDGSINIFANEELLDELRFHQLSGDFCEEDMALTILADYFNEKPANEQLLHRESQCWELHFDFAEEMVLREWIIFDTQIKSWIDQRVGKAVGKAILEKELTEILKTLSIPIIITKKENIYMWKLLNKIDTAPTFVDAIQDALENLTDRFK